MKSRHKTLVEDYLDAHSIVPVAGALQEDLDEDNESGLDLLAYAIENYASLPGVRQNIKAVASLAVNDFDGEREYNNRLTEFFALWFVSEVLKEPITALEATSPNRPSGSNKTCDLQSKSLSGANFYEVKDFSSEFLTQVPVYEGVTSFTPGLPWKIKPWIEGYVQNCVEKGANYLICRVPVWHVRKRPKLSEEWVKRIYSSYTNIPGNRFKVGHGLTLPSFFRGVYVIRRDEHLFMEF